MIKEGVEALVSLKALANEVTDAQEAWTHAVETTLDGIYGLLSKKVPLLMAKVSDIIDTIKNKKVVRTCYEISQSNDHEKNIEELNRHLDAITKAIAIFETPENIEGFTKPLQDVLLLGKDAADVLETNIKVLMKYLRRFIQRFSFIRASFLLLVPIIGIFEILLRRETRKQPLSPRKHA